MKTVEFRVKVNLEVSDDNYEFASRIARRLDERFPDVVHTPEIVLNSAFCSVSSVLLGEIEEDFDEFLNRQLLVVDASVKIVCP